MNTATVAAGTLCRRCRRRDPEPGHPQCLTCADALAKIEVVRQLTPDPEKRPLATRKRVELAVAWTLLALVGWGFIKIAPFLWLMTTTARVVLPGAGRTPAHPLSSLSLPAVPAPGLRRPLVISRKPERGKIRIFHFAKAGVSSAPGP